MLRWTAAVIAAAGLLFLPAGQTWAASSAQHGQVSCGTTATALVAANPARKALVIRHKEDAANDIYVGPGVPSALSTTNGLRIKPGDPAITLEYSGAMSCVAVTGATTLTFIELTN